MFGHPSVSLFRVPVEELQVHALVVLLVPLIPEVLQLLLLIRQGDQLLLHVLGGRVVCIQQLLALVCDVLEVVFVGVDFTLR